VTTASHRAWQDFLAAGQTQRNVLGDFPEWHKGRSRYAVWALALDDDRLRRRLDEARVCLAPYLLADYQRQPHITLHVCGFPAAVHRHDDDFVFAQLQQQFNALHGLVEAPFELSIGGLGSFTTAPYLTVNDASGVLGRLRQALACGGNEWREADYVPHVTVGLYNGAYPVEELCRRMAALATPEPLNLSFRRIALMTYASEEIGGALETVCEYDLADNLLLPGSLFNLYGSL
jgi:2'-5' RNA ligase